MAQLTDVWQRAMHYECGLGANTLPKEFQRALSHKSVAQVLDLGMLYDDMHDELLA